MKNLGKLKLNQLSKAELNDRNLTKLTGGGSCPTTCGTCGCLYEGEPGGSTDAANHQANLSEHKYSPCVDDYDPYC